MLQQRDAASSGRQRVAASDPAVGTVSSESAVVDLVGDLRTGRVIPHADALARSGHLRALIIPSASRVEEIFLGKVVFSD